jgi:hypothetical protein
LPIEPDQCIVTLDAVGDRLFVLYDDLTLIEVSISNKEIVNEQNLADIEDAMFLAG